ncbi:MAG TPA: TIGR03435 family protein, partial [Verrucomicrobiae bacterium]|nr:TIGR03435 family protein [Verrucomicrobiae bacterium]
ARLNSGLMRYMGLGQSAADLATLCENQMHLPVVDRTGLKGVYDYDLDTARPTPAASAPTDGAIAEAADPGPDFATALERQLGLRLEKKKVSVDIIVVDQIARTPTEN